MTHPQELLKRHNELAADAVKQTRACAVYKYPEPKSTMKLPKNARPLFIATQRGTPCLWALVDPQAKIVEQELPLYVPKYEPGYSRGLTDYWVDCLVDDDIKMELPKQHRLLEGSIVYTAQRQSVRFSVHGPYSKEEKCPYLFRLAGTGHPIGNFESRLLTFACPVWNEDLTLVQHLFYLGEDKPTLNET